MRCYSGILRLASVAIRLAITTADWQVDHRARPIAFLTLVYAIIFFAAPKNCHKRNDYDSKLHHLAGSSAWLLITVVSKKPSSFNTTFDSTLEW
jgi:hypothetical protein